MVSKTSGACELIQQKAHAVSICIPMSGKQKRSSLNVNQPAAEVRFQRDTITAKNAEDGM